MAGMESIYSATYSSVCFPLYLLLRQDVLLLSLIFPMPNILVGPGN